MPADRSPDAALADELYGIVNGLPQISRLTPAMRKAKGVDDTITAWVDYMVRSHAETVRRWPGAVGMIMPPQSVARRLGGIGGSEIGVLMADAEKRPQAFFDSDTRSLVARKILVQPPSPATSATLNGNILESTARVFFEVLNPTYVRLSRVDEELGPGVMEGIRASAPPPPDLTPEQKALVFASPDDVFYDAATDEVVLVDYKVSKDRPHTDPDDPMFCQYRDQLNWYALRLRLGGLRVDRAVNFVMSVRSVAETVMVPMPLDPDRQKRMAEVAHDVWTQYVLPHKMVPLSWAKPVDLPATPEDEALALQYAAQAKAIEAMTRDQEMLAVRIAQRARELGSRPDQDREYLGRAKIEWKLPSATIAAYSAEATAILEAAGRPVPRALGKMDWETVEEALRECDVDVARVRAFLEQRAPIDKTAIAKTILASVAAKDVAEDAETADGDNIHTGFLPPDLRDRCLQFLSEHADLSVGVSRRKPHLLPEPCVALIRERAEQVVPNLMPVIQDSVAAASAEDPAPKATKRSASKPRAATKADDEQPAPMAAASGV